MTNFYQGLTKKDINGNINNEIRDTTTDPL